MRIRDDWNALVSWRAYTDSIARADKTATRLSSGQRINTAADDASGLGISQRFRAQFRSLIQANRNALDGISMINTAEGALSEISTMLQRGRELALQSANGPMTPQSREATQTEANSLLDEVDRIVDMTTFNERQLFNPFGNAAAVRQTVTGLRSGWLAQAEKVVKYFYGLVGNNSPLKVVLEAHGPEGAWIQGSPATNGKLDNLELHVNVADFGTIGGPDGGQAPIYNDRKVARAVTQAVMATNTNYKSTESWFKSGAADYIAGLDERVSNDLQIHGQNKLIQNMIDSPVTWSDDSSHRSSAYLATKFLDGKLQANGFTLQDVMTRLSFGDSLSDALSGTIGIDVPTFLADFAINAPAFINSLNLSDADVGGLNPGDAHQVIPDGNTYSTSPMQNFKIDWPTGLKGTVSMDVDLQIGMGTTDTLQIPFPEVNTYTLDLVGIDLVNRPMEAVEKFTSALHSITVSRTELGTLTNRLEHTLNANGVATETSQESLSRIADTDYAMEMTNLAKEQILVSSSGASVAHANTLRDHVLTLLQGANMIEPKGNSQG